MRANELKVGKTYIGKSGLKRKINVFRIYGVWRSDSDGDIYYTPIDREGKLGKEKGCNSLRLCGTWSQAEVKTICNDGERNCSGSSLTPFN